MVDLKRKSSTAASSAAGARRFNDIADRVLENEPQSDLSLLKRAYVYSAKVHEGQERLSGEPYLIHPIEVAGLLADMRLDEVSVVVGLLHDTLEDTLTTYEELERLFGEEVATLVDGLTKISKIEFHSQQERQAENFRKMLLAMSKDIRILMVKLADRLHNMRTLTYMKEDSARRVAQETLDIYAPLAHRLGIHGMQQELEDLAFRTLLPQVAEDLERELAVGRKEREEYIEEVIGILSTKLAQTGLEVEVSGRLKDLGSIHKKMETQGLTLDQIYDVIAFRMVLSAGQESVYTALGIVHSIWRPVAGRFKDYVALPKPNGYQSLHTTVIGPYGERMEVQIRTVEMHRNAEYGIAAHWKYKEGRIAGERDDDRKFAWLRQLMEWQQELEDPHEFIDAVKVDLFPDEVFVFTPRGDVISLPSDACPIDFAYAIHSEVGDHCSGAKVNGTMRPLRHRLQDGDTVEIITNTQQMPRKDWLEFVVSSKARSRIRHAIHGTENARSRELGREMLERELRRAKLSLARLLENGELIEVAKSSTRGGSVEDLFAAVGYGRLPAKAVLGKLRPETQPESKPARRSFFRRRTPSSSGLRVSGQGDVLVRFARCCGPLPGEEVTGFITRGRGVTVHTKECEKVFGLDPERRVDVDWDPKSAVPRRIKIRVHSVDQQGILAKVTKSISVAGINIGSARVTTTQNRRAIGNFELWVTDAKMLKAVMKELTKIRGVTQVERVRQ